MRFAILVFKPPVQPPVLVCESDFQALRMLNVENLVIPSVPELVPMWINKYGFTHIESNLMTELIKYNTLMFPSAVRLHKSLVTHAAASAGLSLFS